MTQQIRREAGLAADKKLGVSVGASLLAKIVNDNAPFLNKRGALSSFASKLAPTEGPVLPSPAT
ncbi:hypothetical protein CRN80_09390 [Pseudomonas sp. FDAARGOS_380]|nr:hypothetical protein CRN80_09390 [Pseudomonas sp. FDAARGOS_380]